MKTLYHYHHQQRALTFHQKILYVYMHVYIYIMYIHDLEAEDTPRVWDLSLEVAQPHPATDGEVNRGTIKICQVIPASLFAQLCEACFAESDHAI